MLHLNFKGETEQIKLCLFELEKELGFVNKTDGINVTVCKRENAGLSVEGKNGEYAVSYGIIPDFCRALCILIDFIKKGEQSFSVDEDREIELCGIMPDLSRNAVLKVETAKDLIRRIARMGMNTFMMYMENIFKMEEYPYFGYMRGAYNEAELREIDEYAQKFGIEVVPCIQTLAHLTNALRWPYANGMKDTADILLIGEPKTYEFIEAMVRTLSRCLSSHRMHIGMDEAFAAGTGQFFQKNGKVEKFEMISGHIAKVQEILKKYGIEATMWDDMLCRYGSKVRRHYDPQTEIPEEIMKTFPTGLTIAYWDYYHDDFETYDGMLSAVKKFTGDVAFYGGVWTWGGLGVNYDKTFRTTRPAMAACRKHGIKEICATLWGDDGAETSYYTALLGIQLFAEYIYHAEVDDKRLEKMFKICTGYDMDSFMLLDIDNLPETENYKKISNPVMNAITVSKQLMYQDILQGLLDKQYEHVDFKGHYKKILDKLALIDVPEDLKELFDYHKQLVKVLYLKCDIGNRITNNYKKDDRKALQKNIEELLELKNEIYILHEKMSELWLRDNKALGLDRLDLRYGGVIMRTQRAADRINAYLSGKIDTVEELDEEKLMFSEEEFVHCPFYNYYSTASMQIEKQW